MDNKRILLECNLVYDLFFQEREGACSFEPLPTSTYPRSAIGKDCKITQITIFIWHILTQINYHHFRLASRIVSKVIFMPSKKQKLEFWVLKLIVELLNCTLGTPNFCRPAGHGLLGAFWILQCDYIDLLDWVKLRTLYLAPIDGLQITVRHDALLGTPRGVFWYPHVLTVPYRLHDKIFNNQSQKGQIQIYEWVPLTTPQVYPPVPRRALEEDGLFLLKLFVQPD